MLAGPGGGNDLFRVIVRIAADRYDVNVWIRQHVLDTFVSRDLAAVFKA